MKRLILFGLVASLILFSGCDNSDCVEDEAESIILINEYKQEHTIRECVEYCDNQCHKTIYGYDIWKSKKCAEFCIE